MHTPGERHLQAGYDPQKPEIICHCWDGFGWVWSWEREKWLIDLQLSGGPPSPHDPSPSEPPFKIMRT